VGSVRRVPALTLPYFVSEPDTPNGRGIVVCHEGLGLTTQILRLGERLAGEGYTVVAPDFFFRTGGPTDTDFWHRSTRSRPSSASSTSPRPSRPSALSAQRRSA
jgi:dienelactone hydrolase